jgi:hypothetical protein
LDVWAVSRDAMLERGSIVARKIELPMSESSCWLGLNAMHVCDVVNGGRTNIALTVRDAPQAA